MEYLRLYCDINSKMLSVIESTLTTSNIADIAKSHLFASDLEKWIAFLGDSHEAVLYKTALGEYLNALYFTSCGLYRQAYIALRFFLEHTMFGVYLSINELNFRLWSIGRQDLYWSEIVDVEKGIFSKNFFDAFSPELVDNAEEMRNICKQLYREFSEYIHGNLLATQVLPSKTQYDDERFRDIIKKVETLKYLISLLFFIRYKDAFNQDAFDTLEQSIIDAVGNSPEVLAFFKNRKGDI